ncbi:MAG: hypothetical protein HZA94_00670 [Candidatus Vogelbacteria bacterium]|nr:hypothetical protein [Candidatus Vogelbacteria bacterium]
MLQSSQTVFGVIVFLVEWKWKGGEVIMTGEEVAYLASISRIEEAVSAVINRCDSLLPINFGIGSRCRPIVFFEVWNYLRLAAESYAEEIQCIP